MIFLVHVVYFLIFNRSLPLKLFSIVKLLLPRPHLAPSTTPGLFTPFHFSSVDGKTSCAAVDGDLMMNNLTTAAVTHVLHNKGDFQSVNGAEDLLVLSIENRALVKRMNNADECSTSMVVDIALDGVFETVDQILGNAFCWNRTDYVRIQLYH